MKAQEEMSGDRATLRSCPYPACGLRDVSIEGDRCKKCGGPVSSCLSCGAKNRRLARHCRSCGSGLGQVEGDWLAYRGDPAASGVNPSPLGFVGPPALDEVFSLELGSVCHGLLSFDSHLVAVGGSGEIVVAAPDGREVDHWSHEGRVLGKSTLNRGTLYVGGERQVSAFSLWPLLEGGRARQRWSLDLPGTPIFGLLTASDLVYSIIAVSRGERNLVLLDDRSSGGKPAQHLLGTFSKVSWLARSEGGKGMVCCISEVGGKLSLHQSNPARNPQKLETRVIEDVRGPLVESVPIAAFDESVYAVLGENNQLCRLHNEKAVFERLVSEDVNSFSLFGRRDGVVVKTDAIHFLGRNRSEVLHPNERLSTEPIVIGERLVAMGMRSGKLRWYDLNNPSTFFEERVSAESDHVVSIASYGDRLAVGCVSGRVRVYRVVEVSE